MRTGSDADARSETGLFRDALAALLLACVLSLCWAANDWAQVGRLNLPDSDDMMRLAQVRDWIGGQGFNDWTQYRLAPPAGAPMHWSRINDFGPAAIILLARPFVGQHGAELAAVLLYPALLFALYLFLSARLARHLGGAAAALPATILAAIAYPAVSLFLPGRIDHHALQIVLVLGCALALQQPRAVLSGAAAGVAAAASFGIGLESVPQIGALTALLFARWVVRGDAERTRMAAFAAALLGVTLLMLAAMRPHYWSAQWCDTFTPASTNATLAGAGVLLILALVRGIANDWRVRLGVGAAAGAVALGIVLAVYPVCLTGPYGPMDPLVRHAFMDNVVEARGIFAQRLLGHGIPTIGLMLAATAAGAWLWWKRGAERAQLMPLLAVLLVSDLVALAQIRAAYIGSAVAAPILAQLILAARRQERWRLPALLGAWAASAGMTYLLLPQLLERRVEPAARATFAAHQACKAGDTWQQLDRFTPGVVMVPMDEAAYLIGGTHHASVAAGYHRNNRGNRAMYDFFLADPAYARTIAARWSVDYVAICPTDFGELDVRTAYPDSLASSLLRGRVPAWLEPLPLRDTGLRFYRVR